MPRFWLSGPRILGIRPGISFRPDELRRLGIVGSVALAIIKGVLAVVLTIVVWVCFYLIYLLVAGAPAKAEQPCYHLNDGSTNQNRLPCGRDEPTYHWEVLDFSQAAPGYWSMYSNGQRFFHQFHIPGPGSDR